MVEGKRRGLLGSANFDLDEREGAAVARRYRLLAGNPRAAVEDSPAVQPQLQADEYFGAATALLRLLTIHFERSSARA